MPFAKCEVKIGLLRVAIRMFLASICHIASQLKDKEFPRCCVHFFTPTLTHYFYMLARFCEKEEMDTFTKDLLHTLATTLLVM